jgi:hypothetical protein
MTRIRSWTARTTSFASVVMMAQVSRASPAGPCQRSHRPAKAKGLRLRCERVVSWDPQRGQAAAGAEEREETTTTVALATLRKLLSAAADLFVSLISRLLLLLSRIA